MVRPRRFERLTHSLEGCCSILLSYGRMNIFFLLDDLFSFVKSFFLKNQKIF